MADEPENLTLKLLREMRAEQECLATMLGKVTDAVTAITTTQKHHSQILTRHFELLEKILETQHNYGYRIECNRWAGLRSSRSTRGL
ncbi:MAG: hypothetical protein WCF79_00560 [Rhodomicrobium sp.]